MENPKLLFKIRNSQISQPLAGRNPADTPTLTAGNQTKRRVAYIEAYVTVLHIKSWLWVIIEMLRTAM